MVDSYSSSGAFRKVVRQSTLSFTTFKTKDVDMDAPRNSVICTPSSSYNSSGNSNMNGRGGTSNNPQYDMNSTATGLVVPKKNPGHIPVKQKLEQVPSTKNVFGGTDNNNSGIMKPPTRQKGNKRMEPSSSRDEDVDMDDDDDDFQGVLSKSSHTQLLKPDKTHINHTRDIISKAKATQSIQNLLLHNRGKKKADFSGKVTAHGLLVPDGLPRSINDDDDDFKESSTPKIFIKPAKKSGKRRKRDEEQNKVLDKFEQIKKKDAEEESKEKCPYCSQILWPLPQKVETALKEIKKRDKDYEKKQNLLFEKENSKSSSSYSIPLALRSKRLITTEEKDSFCLLHRVEMHIKPEGKAKGYPEHINFGKMPSRIQFLKSELDEVIRNEIESEYRQMAEDAYKEQGVVKARSAMSVLNRFEASLPGYYGPKGSAVILNALVEIYLNTGFLKNNLVSPQLPLEFLQQVLVPEVGFRLIRADLMRRNGKNGPPPGLSKKAKEVMKESREYGSAMFPAEEADIEFHEVENPLSFHLSNDDSERDEESGY